MIDPTVFEVLPAGSGWRVVQRGIWHPLAEVHDQETAWKSAQQIAQSARPAVVLLKTSKGEVIMESRFETASDGHNPRLQA